MGGVNPRIPWENHGKTIGYVIGNLIFFNGDPHGSISKNGDGMDWLKEKKYENQVHRKGMIS